jgi:predicted hydrolase (HD superfamily)
MKREEAIVKLHEWVQSASLRRHSYAVESVMRAAAAHYGTPEDDAEQWAVAGLLHDADYEIAPEAHPRLIVEWLRERGEIETAYAISAHGVAWGVPHLTRMDKALVACAELTGFVVACSLLRPDGLASLTAASVLKKLKDRKFAAGVDRVEVYEGARLLGVELTPHIEFIISTLRAHAAELGLAIRSTDARPDSPAPLSGNQPVR